MSFALQALASNLLAPFSNGSQYSFPYNGPDLQVNPGESVNIPLQYSLSSLPNNFGFELFPHQDMISKGFQSAQRMLQTVDYGVNLSHNFKLGNKEQKKTISKGTNLFKGILKGVGSTAMSILPFIGEIQNQQIQCQILKKKKLIKKSRI